MIRNERGFTLLEMLVVLMIVMLLSTMVLYYSHDKLIKYTHSQMMNQVELYIRMTQMKAVEEQVPYLFTVVNGKRITVKELEGSEPLFEQQLPKGHYITLDVAYSQLYFKINGNVKSFGSITYDFGNVKMGYNIYIGKGRIAKRSEVYE